MHLKMLSLADLRFFKNVFFRRDSEHLLHMRQTEFNEQFCIFLSVAFFLCLPLVPQGRIDMTAISASVKVR